MSLHPRCRSRTSLFLVLPAFACIIVLTAALAAGDHDATLGSVSPVTTDLGGRTNAAYAIALQSVGEMPLAGRLNQPGQVFGLSRPEVTDGQLNSKAGQAKTASLEEAYGQLPLSFEVNQGQTDERVKFFSRGQGYSLFLTPTEAVLALRKPAVNSDRRESLAALEMGGGNTVTLKGAMASATSSPVQVELRLKLLGASPAPMIQGPDELPGKTNYFIGNDSKQWRTGVMNYAKVKCEEVYPGVDLVYYGNQRQLEYDFVVAPGADTKRIRLEFMGAEKLEVNGAGDFVPHVGEEDRQHTPVIYQEMDGVKYEIVGRHVIKGEQEVGFEIGEYASTELVIDPILVYSTYLGRAAFDVGNAIAVDSSGNAYVTGSTTSLDFPTANPPQPANDGGTDGFVARLGQVGISGRVVDGSGNRISGVTLNLGGAVSTQTTTDSNGNFAFGDLDAGNYTLTPSSNNYTFSPASHTFNNVNGDRIANFVATQSVVTISGKVVNASSVGINSVTVALTKNGVPDGTALTDNFGNYSFGNLAAAANYVVMAVGSFSPSNLSFSNLSTNATANFQAAPSIPPQCNSVSFGRTDFAVGSRPYAVAIGDFNNDAKSDLAVANFGSDNISILLGTGTGGFNAATNFAAGTVPHSVAVGDFNNDGRNDLAVANLNSFNVSILLGTGTGTFGAATNFVAGLLPAYVAVGDFNSDGNSDLVVANADSANVSVLLGSGTGSFGVTTHFGTGIHPVGITIGDFNSDGKSDLATANQFSDNVSVLLGTGAGSFTLATNFAAGAAGPLSVATGDFNGDGRSDLAVATQSSSNVSILLGSGTGTFGAPSNLTAGVQPFSAGVGDFNGDGKSDLAVATFGDNAAAVLLGTGTGTFGSSFNFPIGSAPRSVAIGDFNADGKSDLAFPNQNSGNISALLNTSSSCSAQTSLNISGRIAAANNSSLAEVAVTLSGPITRVLATDANGNYSFANLAPGGNYAVTVQSPYYVFAPSRVDFFNLSGNQTANFTAAPVVVPSPLPPPSDDFSGTVRDASKWSLGTVTLPPGSFDPRVDVRQINGQLVISPLVQVTGRHYNGYVSANSFDMRGGSISVELVRPAPGGADTIFAIGSDSNDFYRFLVHTPGAPSAIVNVVGPDGMERPLDETGTQLIFQVGSGGTPLAIPYDPVLHRFKRFRHDAPANAIVFETSPNNIDFTERHRETLTRSVSALTVELSAGTSNPTNPGSAVFDNLSLVVSTFQFSSANYTVNEGTSSILITVTRSGSTAGTATVNYATVDGTATQSSRYINAAGRLTFEPGEASRTFRILIVDNVLTEGDQNVNLILQDPMGPGLNTPGRAVLTIIDNDTVVPTSRPLDNPTFYVTQHYYDFLNREPDAGGLAFWVNEITSCNGEPSCVERKRINVSAAYFLSIEFQETGFLVHRFYNAALNRSNGLPRYLEFFRDTQAIGRGVVVGAPGYEALLEANKVAYAVEFAARAEFTALYPSTQTPEQFVDALYARAVITPSSAERQAAIAEFNTPTGARGRVVRRVAENPTLRARELNRAFVLAQYFGYLRRNPDDAPDNNLDGYNFWLNKLNQFNGDYVAAEMVKAFITSGEYRSRFGP